MMRNMTPKELESWLLARGMLTTDPLKLRATSYYTYRILKHHGWEWDGNRWRPAEIGGEEAKIPPIGGIEPPENQPQSLSDAFSTPPPVGDTTPPPENRSYPQKNAKEGLSQTRLTTQNTPPEPPQEQKTQNNEVFWVKIPSGLVVSGRDLGFQCRCGASIAPESRFCPSCGRKLGLELLDRPVAPKSNERRLVSSALRPAVVSVVATLGVLFAWRMFPAVWGKIRAVKETAPTQQQASVALHPVLKVVSADFRRKNGRFMVEAMVSNPSDRQHEGTLVGRFLDADGVEVLSAKALPAKFPPGLAPAVLWADNHPQVVSVETWVEK